MKSSEIKKLISQYREIRLKQKKKHVDTSKLVKVQKEIEQRYFHETGRILKADLIKS